MRPPSLHSNFFSSLKQVEKRLKLEKHSEPSKLSPSSQEHPVPHNNSSTQTQSLSSPIYLHIDQTNNENEIINSSLNFQESNEPPQAFLFSSPQFSLAQYQSPPPPDHPINYQTDNGVDDIELLIQLLGLSDHHQGEGEPQEGGFGDCEDVFYEKIAGVKGPRCRKEEERLEEWIKWFLKKKDEPLRLAFLLLGKAAYVYEGSDDPGVDGLDFPSAINHYLKYDPPKE